MQKPAFTLTAVADMAEGLRAELAGYCRKNSVFKPAPCRVKLSYLVAELTHVDRKLEDLWRNPASGSFQTAATSCTSQTIARTIFCTQPTTAAKNQDEKVMLLHFTAGSGHPREIRGHTTPSLPTWRPSHTDMRSALAIRCRLAQKFSCEMFMYISTAAGSHTVCASWLQQCSNRTPGRQRHNAGKRW